METSWNLSQFFVYCRILELGNWYPEEWNNDYWLRQSLECEMFSWSWSRGHFKNTYKLLNLRAHKFSPVNKIYIFKCVGRYFVWNFKGTLWNSTQNALPIHWKIWFLDNIEVLRALRFKSSYAFLKRSPEYSHHLYLLTAAWESKHVCKWTSQPQIQYKICLLSTKILIKIRSYFYNGNSYTNEASLY